MADNQGNSEQEWSRMRLWQIQPIRDLCFIAAIVGLIYLGAVLSVVTIPLLLGLGLAYLIEPLLRWVHSRWAWATRPRVLTCMVVICLLAGAFILLLTIPRLITQGNDLVKNRAVYAERMGAALGHDWVPDGLRDSLQPGLQWLANSSDAAPEASQSGDQEPFADRSLSPGSSDHQIPPEAVQGSQTENQAELLRALVQEEIQKMQLSSTQADESAGVARFMPSGSQLQRVFSAVMSLFGGLINGAMFIFLSIFFLFCFSLSYPKITAGLWQLVPEKNTERLTFLVGRMDAAVSGFVRGRILICATMALVYGIGWTLFGIPYALLLAIITGVLGLIPYAAVGMLPIACLLLALDLQQGGDSFWYHSDEGSIRYWAVFVFPLLIFGLAQILDDYVLTPIIQGKATNLDMVSVVVAVIAGGSLAGLYGMLLAIPVAACLRIVIVEVFVPYLRSWSKGERKDLLPLD